MKLRWLVASVIVVTLLGVDRAGAAQPAPPDLTPTARSLVRYLPSAAELPVGFRPATPLIEGSNEAIVGSPGFVDLAPVVRASRRMTEVGFVSRRDAPPSTLGTFVGAFVDAEGAWTYARDYTFTFAHPPIQEMLPGPDVGERSVLYSYTTGSGAAARQVFHLTFQRDRLQVESILNVPAAGASVDDAVAAARVIDRKIQAMPPGPPTEADLALVEEPTPAVLVRGAVRLFLEYFVDELDAAVLLAEAWDGAARALRNAGVANVPAAPVYPSDEDAAIDLHMREFERLEILAEGRLTQQQLARAAIAAITDARDDCHTAYRTPEQWLRDRAGFLGQEQLLIGYGAEKPSRDAPLRIVRVLPGSPAQAAGMRRGQEIVSINGTPVAGLTVTEAGDLLDRREGAQNTIVLRNPSGSTFTITVAPARFTLPPMESQILPGGIGLLRFYSFDVGERQIQLMREALTNFEAMGVQGWIIDLRDNGGGSGETNRLMQSLFIEGGRLYGRIARNQDPVWSEASGMPLPFQRPLVVLTSRGSGSAGEIFPGALQARGRAIVVGETTAGCIGGFLGGQGLLDGSVVQVTTNEVVIGPDAVRLHRMGVQPNVRVAAPTPEEDELGIDRQLDAAIEVLRQLIGPSAQPMPMPEPPKKSAVVLEA